MLSGKSDTSNDTLNHNSCLDSDERDLALDLQEGWGESYEGELAAVRVMHVHGRVGAADPVNAWFE